MLEKEFNLLIRLNHPSVVRAAELTDLPGVGRCIVMEWIDGLPLDRRLTEERPSRRVRRRLAASLTDALAYIHSKGVTHRDLKPSNILIDDEWAPHIIDFGLGDDAGSALLKRVTGTAGYVAPEVAAGSVTDWRRADVYALGLMLGRVGGSWRYRLAARWCCRRNPLRRPADGAVVKRLIRRFGVALWSVLAAVAIAAAALAILSRPAPDDRALPKQESVRQADSASKQGEPQDVSKTETAPAPSLPKTDETPKQSVAAEPEPEKRQEDTPDKPQQSPERAKKFNPATALNSAVLFARQRRDELKRGNATDGRRLFYAYCDSLQAIGERGGWSEEQTSFWRRKVRCEMFYENGITVFY